MNATSWPTWSPPALSWTPPNQSAATTPALSVSIIIGIVMAPVRTAAMF